MANLACSFFALWCLGGWVAHLYLGRTRGPTYRVVGETILQPIGRKRWGKVVMPKITVFTLLLAAFELVTGLLILGKGRAVTLGLTASVLFNQYLVHHGLGSRQPNVVSDVSYPFA